MGIEMAAREEFARLYTGGILALLGVAQLAWPGCFASVTVFFRGARKSLSPDRVERLDRVIESRARAEGDEGRQSRLVGVVTIAAAALELLPQTPFIFPYAIACLAMAVALLVTYLRFRRVAEVRVAPLVRRTPLAALPPAIILAAALCFAGTAIFSAVPQFRAGAIAVLVSMGVLLWIAWRVAISPAMLFGDDPEFEYAVDAHVRFGRATGLVALACAPAVVLVCLAIAELPPSAHFLGAVTLLVLAGFAIAQAINLGPLVRPMKLA